MVTTIVVPVDDSPTCERALPVAASIARATGATVELLTVDPLGADPTWADHRLGELAGRLPEDLPTVRTVLSTTGTVAEALAHLDRGPGAVVCVAPHGRGPLASLVLGSVTDGLVHHGTLPVLLVGPACAEPREGDSRPVLAAVDGSERDENVVRAAAEWAAATGARLELVHVVTRPSDPRAWELADEALAAAEAAARPGGVATTTSLVAAADPGEGLRRALAAGASCVVVASHRRNGVGRMVLGSTVADLGRRAPCPVLVAAPATLVGVGIADTVRDDGGPSAPA